MGLITKGMGAIMKKLSTASRNKSSKKLFKEASGGLQHPVIKSFKPKLTKGESTAIKLHKFKGAIKKGSDAAEDAIRTGVKKFKKSIDKMKDPK